MTKWTALLQSLITHSIHLLGPADASCLVCGGRRQGRPAGLPDGLRLGDWLCAECAARIPWISRPVCPRCGRPVFCPDCIRQPVRAFEMNRSAVRYTDDMKEWLALYKFRGDERYGEVLAEMMRPAYERLTAEVRAAAMTGAEAGAAVPGPQIPVRFDPEGRSVRHRSADPPEVDSRPDHMPDRMRSGLHSTDQLIAGLWPHRLHRIRRSAVRVWHAVTYVPVSRERAEERGFNQAERLARAAAMRADAPLVPLIRRLRDTGKQSQRGRAERLRAMRAVFGPDESAIRKLAASAVRAGHPPGAPLRILLVDDIYTTGSTAEACAEAIRAAAPCPVRVYVLTWARS